MSTQKKTNRLFNEKSPYLLQHATNPVNWYPWGDEAFKKAKDENKPIFLSVGYSTCHWCHVMEHESFEDEEIAKILNENFVSVKVDREERPDVDKLYMTFIQSLTGGGGWPMSVFLTPELEPISGGTYFPPRDSFGRIGFASVLTIISDKWKIDNVQIREQGREMAESIRNALQSTANKDGQKPTIPKADSTFNACFEWLSKRFDSTFGGFGSAPKFPKTVDFDFLLNFHAIKKPSVEADKSLSMLKLTFEKMFEGGIHDHVGKGFHRYSVDSKWHVPHFEKMLYDQGQLLRSFSNFCKTCSSDEDKELAIDAITDIANYLNTNLSHPLGGFYSAEDADSLPEKEAKKKREGAFCVWTKNEVERVLGDRPARHNENVCLDEIVCAAFGVRDEGNVPSSADPHDELKLQNILHLVTRPQLEEISKEHKMSLSELRECIEDSKRFLAEERAKRPKPHLDNKLVTAWNALAISGFCAASATITDEQKSKEYRERAEIAVKFIREHLYNVENGELLRSIYVDENGNIVQSSSPIMAFSDDYAFLIEALIDLYSINFDENLLEWAEHLQNKMDLLFFDSTNNSGYFTSRAGDQSIFARIVDEQDGAEPCSTSIAISNLLRLSSLLNSKEYKQRAESVFLSNAWIERLNKCSFAVPRLLISLYSLTNPQFQFIIVGANNDLTTQKMLRAIQQKYLPMATIIFLDDNKIKINSNSFLLQKNSHLKDYIDIYKTGGPPTIFLCRADSCEMPINSLEELQKRLAKL
uniref:Thioredox_DsbH domain-containing protein n=1 Tax=Meloidogyne hapla TaxID=6305 RepID=A0A1I8BTH5_MELHA